MIFQPSCKNFLRSSNIEWKKQRPKSSFLYLAGLEQRVNCASVNSWYRRVMLAFRPWGQRSTGRHLSCLTLLPAALWRGSCGRGPGWRSEWKPSTRLWSACQYYTHSQGGYLSVATAYATGNPSPTHHLLFILVGSTGHWTLSLNMWGNHSATGLYPQPLPPMSGDKFSLCSSGWPGIPM